MKVTGFIRKIDDLGRIIIPIELRRTMGFNDKESVEILVDGEHVILKKYEPVCFFCGNKNNVQRFHGKAVCGKCATALFERTKAM